MELRQVMYLVVVMLLSAAMAAYGQRDDEEERSVNVSPVEEPPDEEDRGGPTLIGMEAYREVLASGRYKVGPGDEFLIYIPGMEEPVTGPVMAEGGLFVPGVGSVPVAGCSLRTAKKRIERAFAQAFQQGEITAELSKLRSLPVAVVGAVGSPGVVMTSGVQRVSEVIRKAGDLDDRASHRNIRVIKTGRIDPEEWARVRHSTDPADYLGLTGVSVRIDLELYNVTGDSRYNPFIEDGDRVIVPARGSQVVVRGAVNQEGFFEFVPGDRISDLLALARGLAPSHDPDRVFLFRMRPEGTGRISIPVDLKRALAADPAADATLVAEDWLVVRRLAESDRSRAVRVLGEVVYPGYYIIEKGQTRLREVIQAAGGFTEDASLWESRVVRAQVTQRTGSGAATDPEYERIAAIPVADRTDEENQYFIMKSREKKGQMVVDFVALFEGGDESQNIALLSDDLIYVPRTRKTVIVSGRAAYPGAVTYAPDMTVWDYIEEAGGLGWRASRDIQVIKARTGETKRAENVAQLDPGDRIWIKEKPQRDYWKLFKETMTMLGELSTVVLVYTTLTN